MPWNFSKKVPQIFEAVEARGCKLEVPAIILRQEIIRVTGVTNSSRHTEYIKLMVDLGYLHVSAPGIYVRCVDAEHPYVFPLDTKSKAKK
jgi:hypothetical protein